jgi:hypothetical protein
MASCFNLSGIGFGLTRGPRRHLYVVRFLGCHNREAPLSPEVSFSHRRRHRATLAARIPDVAGVASPMGAYRAGEGQAREGPPARGACAGNRDYRTPAATAGADNDVNSRCSNIPDDARAAPRMGEAGAAAQSAGPGATSRAARPGDRAHRTAAAAADEITGLSVRSITGGERRRPRLSSRRISRPSLKTVETGRQL